MKFEDLPTRHNQHVIVDTRDGKEYFSDAHGPAEAIRLILLADGEKLWESVLKTHEKEVAAFARGPKTGKAGILRCGPLVTMDGCLHTKGVIHGLRRGLAALDVAVRLGAGSPDVMGTDREALEEALASVRDLAYGDGEEEISPEGPGIPDFIRDLVGRMGGDVESVKASVFEVGPEGIRPIFAGGAQDENAPIKFEDLSGKGFKHIRKPGR